MTVQLSDEEREIYNYAIDRHIVVSDLKDLLFEGGFNRSPHVIVCALRRLRFEYGLMDVSRYNAELARDAENTRKYKQQLAKEKREDETRTVHAAQ